MNLNRAMRMQTNSIKGDNRFKQSEIILIRIGSFATQRFDRNTNYMLK